MIAFAEAFSDMFAACGAALMANITGILPTVMVLLMVFNTICRLVGNGRVEKFSRFLAKHRLLAYTVLPFISWFFLCNPAVHTSARFLPQRQRASYIDVCTTTNGPMLSLFPHINPGELFIWLGIATGVEQLGYSSVPLAIRFFIAGWIVALIRGVVTEWFWVFLAKREGVYRDEAQAVETVAGGAPADNVEAVPVEPVPEAGNTGKGGVVGVMTRVIQTVGRGIGLVVNAFFDGAKQAVNMTIGSILPFLIFLSFMSGLLTYSGIGTAVADLLTPLVGSVMGLIVFALITSIPFLSPLLAPGAVVPSILGTLIGTMIAAGQVPVALALPALFAISVTDACDFIPTAAALGEAEPDTARIATPAILFSRFVTAPIAVLIGVVAGIGLF